LAAFFLPFDLDQFEYQDVPGRRRSEQLFAFRKQNEMVRKVGALYFSTAGTNVANQIDGWYHNTVKTDPSHLVLQNQFDSQFVPSGWSQTTADTNVYRSVVRRSCRNCHITNSLPFSNASDFAGAAGIAAADLCNYQMPHALQTVREFWLSSAPSDLESYYRAVGQTAAADRLHACGPGNVVTLDPPQISASLSSAALL